MSSVNNAQRLHAREIAVVGHESGGIDRQGARCLDRIRQPEAEQSPQPRGIFGDLETQFDALP